MGAADHADRIFVEIAVTHFVCEAKMARVTAANTPLVEFDLSSIREVSWKALRSALTTPNAVAAWLFHPSLVAALAEQRASLRPILEQQKRYAEDLERERAARQLEDAAHRREEEEFQHELDIEQRLRDAARRKEQNAKANAQRARQPQLKAKVQRFRESPEAEKARTLARTFDREKLPLALATKVAGGRSFGVSNQAIWQAVLFRRHIHHAVSEGHTAIEKEHAVETLRDYFEVKLEFLEADQVAVWKYLTHLCSLGALRRGLGGSFHVLVSALEPFETLQAFRRGAATVAHGLRWTEPNSWPDERVSASLARAHSHMRRIQNFPGRDPIVLPVVFDRTLADVLEIYSKGIDARAVLEYWISAGFIIQSAPR
ncbi:hypothetical protein [Paraburkholderia dipogonis]|uniref:hypothetical protein n=1 Tax=Paraburkholderia dipogonis TaxID=1211383 RepID=UPI0038BAE7A6